MTVTVRPAREDAEIARAGELTLTAYRHLFGRPLDDYEDALRNAAARAKQAELVVAVDEAGTVLGTVTYVPDGGPWGEIAEPGEAEFRMLAVDPAAQRGGVGRALVTWVVEESRRRGKQRVVMSSGEIMTTAHRIYESFGFVRTPERDWSPVPGMTLRTFRLEL